MKKIIGMSAMTFALMGAASVASATDTMTGSTMGGVNAMQGPYEQCMTYVKMKNLTGIDCKEQVKTMHQEIKTDRMQMNQEIKDDRMKMKQENKDNRAMMGSGMKMSQDEMSDYMRKPLTADEQTVLKSLHDKQRTEHDALRNDTTLTSEQKASKLKELIAGHITALLPYVATDKQDAFKKMMEARMSMVDNMKDMHDANKENRQEFRDTTKEKRQDFKDQVKAKKMALSEKLQSQLTAALEKLPLEKLQKVLSNVDAVTARVTASTAASDKKERILAQLKDIKEIVQQKINSMTDTAGDSSLLQEVLTGSPTTTVTQ